MTKVVSSLFSKPEKPKGPSEAELALQQQQRDKAAQDMAEAERLKALAGKATSRRQSLAFSDRKATLG
jgi:hypothetical protein